MKVCLIAALTVDGFIGKDAGHSSLDWTSKEDKQFFVEKTKELGTLIVGRTTFETFKKPLPNRRNIVLTSTPEKYEVEGAEFTSEDPKQLLARLEGEGVESVAVIGGSKVYSQFLEEGLVTDLYLTVEPVMFGSGVPLAQLDTPVQMELESERLLNSSTVLLHYVVR